MYLLFSVMNSLLPKYYTNTLQVLDCFVKHSFSFVGEGEGMNNVNSDCILQKILMKFQKNVTIALKIIANIKSIFLGQWKCCSTSKLI